MNETIDNPTAREYEINIRIIFVNGDTFEQPLSFNEIDGAQNMINWYRNKKGCPVWTWHVPSVSKLHMLSRSHIMAIDIDGYIEPEMNKVKWYQRLADKWQTFRYLRWEIRGKRFSMKGGVPIERQSKANEAS